jgi:hypothetical protein
MLNRPQDGERTVHDGHGVVNVSTDYDVGDRTAVKLCRRGADPGPRPVRGIREVRGL